MKILELRFQNLNSLYGEWHIDFTHPEYTSNGIFALTGPTGSGKSTILDAICLALYGATPRLGKITKSGNEIMSRQTGECFAEVVFESQAGKFRCHWEQHRSRKKSDGELQHPKHEIAEAGEDGKVIEHQIRRVAEVIEAKTGMDFDRFTRSILLAQGGFDTFLKADEKEKSIILEQITGTEIYSEISKRVHERRKEEQSKLDVLQAAISGIAILEPEQEQAMKQELTIKEKEDTELAKQVEATSKAITWLTGIDTLTKDLASLSEDSKNLQVELEAFKPDRERLTRAQKAATLDVDYATLTGARKQQEEDAAALKTEENKLPNLEDSFKKHAESLSLAEQKTQQAKEALEQAASLFQEVRSLDQTLSMQKKTASEEEKKCKEQETTIASTKQSRTKAQDKRTTIENKSKQVDDYLKEHAQDEWLIGNLAGVEEQLNSLQSKQKEIAQQTTEKEKAVTTLEKATKKVDACTKQHKSAEETLKTAENKHKEATNSLNSLLDGRLLREYRREKDDLIKEKGYLARITSLEEERAKLEDGKECPLCGSKEHPFATGNIPVPDEIEKQIETVTALINKAEKQETTLKKLGEVEVAAEKKLAETERFVSEATYAKKRAAEKLSDLNKSQEKMYHEFNAVKQAVTAKVQPLGVTEIPGTEVSVFLESLRQRLETWQTYTREKANIEKNMAEYDSEIKQLDSIIELQNNELTERQKALEVARKDFADNSKARQEMFGSKHPDKEEKQLNEAITTAEKTEKKARQIGDELQQKLTSTKAAIEALKKRIDQQTHEIKALEDDFSTKMHDAGFTNENKFIEARLKPKEMEALAVKEKQLEKRQTKLDALQKDRQKKLTVELEKKITDSTLEELKPQGEAFEGNLKTVRESVSDLRSELKKNREAKEKIKEKQKAIEIQKTMCARWDKLHNLIGSSDGKKYRNFAQGLTFELMVSHANRQLAKMSDRYLLIRNERDPLELDVVDNYQAGEIRSTRNLSGGESFLVSLSLALGLSKMASRKVRVDSLFLDEGFGTLDEDALETALETLSGLQQDGKLIGVISHVLALKERIATQIAITPISGGKSALTGPGCAKQ